MQIDPTSGFPAAGRRRLTTLSKEEWREALEQQRREKEALQRRPRHESDNQSRDTTGASTTPLVPVENADVAVNNRSGRRFVAAMSAEEWKASLAQQIREKELQREQQKRTHTAPDAPTEASELVATSEAPRSQSATVEPACLPGLTEDAVTLAGRRRRGGAPQQSREEYLRSLQEQIELKKKREEADGATQSGRGRLGKRRVIEDDDDDGGFWPPLPVAAPPATTTASAVNSTAAVVETQPSKEAEVGLADSEGKVAVDGSTAAPPGVAPASEANPAVTLHPAALSKLFELCEGMKQQNEELKQQLRDQKSVLASLAVATTTPSTRNAAGAKSVSKPGKTPAKKSSKPEVEAKARDKKPKESNPTTTKTAVAKAEPKQPTLLKRKSHAAKELADSSTPKKPPSTSILKERPSAAIHDEESSAAIAPEEPALVKNLPGPKQTKPSRLPQPRVVPRLRSAQALAVKTSSILETAPTELADDCPASVSTTCEPTPSTHVAPLPVPAESSAPSDAAVGDAMPKHDDVRPETELPSARTEEIPASEIALEPEQRSCSLPRLVPSPPIRRNSVPTKKPAPSERTSLPLLPTRSSFSLAAPDDCLDRTATSTSTRVRVSYTRSRAVDAGDLDAQCSSVAMLDGPSAMVPCGSTLLPF